MVFGMVLAGLCLFRAVQADEIEVYDSQEHDSARSTDEGDEQRAEIRLTRPDEAEARIADEQGYEMVPGVERIWNAERSHKNEISVPVKQDRKIASEPAPEQPVRDGVATTSSEAAVKAEVMEPSHASRGNWVEHTPRYGLKAEPRVETRLDPPVPASSGSGRVGTQEVSLIVSDYGYFPNRIFVTQNVPVKIYMTTPSKNTLCFMLDSWGLKKGINPGKVEEITFTPSSAGNYRFYCPVKSIEGTLTVREAPLAEQSTRGLASEEERKFAETARAAHNEPKNANELRSLIED